MRLSLLAILLLLFHAAPSVADIATPAPMVEDTDGDIQPNEYRVISADKSTTRRACPYTCEMRQIPLEHCKQWKSLSDSQCYVQDLRLGGSDAMPTKDRH